MKKRMINLGILTVLSFGVINTTLTKAEEKRDELEIKGLNQIGHDSERTDETKLEILSSIFKDLEKRTVVDEGDQEFCSKDGIQYQVSSCDILEDEDSNEYLAKRKLKMKRDFLSSGGNVVWKEKGNRKYVQKISCIVASGIFESHYSVDSSLSDIHRRKLANKYTSFTSTSEYGAKIESVKDYSSHKFGNKLSKTCVPTIQYATTFKLSTSIKELGFSKMFKLDTQIQLVERKGNKVRLSQKFGMGGF